MWTKKYALRIYADIIRGNQMVNMIKRENKVYWKVMSIQDKNEIDSSSNEIQMHWGNWKIKV